MCTVMHSIILIVTVLGLVGGDPGGETPRVAAREMIASVYMPLATRPC